MVEQTETLGWKVADLIKKCEILGVQPTPTRRRKNEDGTYRYDVSKKDAIEALQKYFINKYKSEGTLSPFIETILNLGEPMLALQIKHHKPEVQEEIWKNGSDWIMEEKIDGCRARLCYDPVYGFDIYSRNLSITDFLPISYKETIIFLNSLLGVYPYSFIIDTELVPMNNYIDKDIEGVEVIADTPLNLMTSILGSLPELSHKLQSKNPVKFVAFDCIMFNGEMLINKTLRERKEVLNRIYNDIKPILQGQIELVPNAGTSDKHEYYRQLLSAGKEGAVCKDLNSTYDIKGRRAGEWVKIKRSVTQALENDETSTGDTVDAFVIGFEKGNKGTINEHKVGAIKFGIYLTDNDNNYILDENDEPIVHHIATISGFSQALRDAITEVDENGEPRLNPKYYGYVAEIDGQDISAKEKRLAHAILIRWRQDKQAQDCKIQQAYLDSLVL